MIEERLKKLEEAVFGKTNTKIKKYDYVRMGGIDWICYKVINDNTFLTTVKELSEEIINEIIDEKRLANGKYVRYNNDVTDDTWKNSVIRRILNNKFLEKLPKDKLNLMKKDYVRLLKKKEVEELDGDLHIQSDEWYWTMTSNTDENDFYAVVFLVRGSSYPGYLTYTNVNNSSGVVRPVVSLKSSVLVTGGSGTGSNPYTLTMQ